MRSSLLIFLIFIYFSSFSQDQDILDTVAEKSCSCLEDADWSDKNIGEIEMTLGLCIIEKALPYKAEISEQHEIDFVDLDGDSGERLGELVGMRMMNYCPDLLIQLGEMMSEEYLPEEENLSFKGTISKEELKQFLMFAVIDESGAVTNFIWLTDFPGSADLIALKKLKGSTIYIEYDIVEMYNPKTKLYQSFNRILYSELID